MLVVMVSKIYNHIVIIIKVVIFHLRDSCKDKKDLQLEQLVRQHITRIKEIIQMDQILEDILIIMLEVVQPVNQT